MYRSRFPFPYVDRIRRDQAQRAAALRQQQAEAQRAAALRQQQQAEAQRQRLEAIRREEIRRQKELERQQEIQRQRVRQRLRDIQRQREIRQREQQKQREQEKQRELQKQRDQQKQQQVQRQQSQKQQDQRRQSNQRQNQNRKQADSNLRQNGIKNNLLRIKKERQQTVAKVHKLQPGLNNKASAINNKLRSIAVNTSEKQIAERILEKMHAAKKAKTAADNSSQPLPNKQSLPPSSEKKDISNDILAKMKEAQAKTNTLTFFDTTRSQSTSWTSAPSPTHFQTNTNDDKETQKILDIRPCITMKNQSDKKSLLI